MKTIGMLGGMSWESTVTYYQICNRTVQKQLGGLHSARCLLHSVDFHEVEALQSTGQWEECGRVLGEAAAGLERAGADFCILCTNTMHKVADQIQASLSIPLLHIADITAEALLQQGIRSVGLLGTRYTMEQDFYVARLRERGLDVCIPNAADIPRVNAVIFDELCRGVVSDASRDFYLRCIDGLARRGAQGCILGCTEIGLLVHQKDTPVPLFDTARIHAERAALYALGL